MKKKNDSIYDTYLTIDHLRSTWEIVRRTCKNRKGVYKFLLNENVNLYTIYSVLKKRNYTPYPFQIFLIFEPKPRLVMSQCVMDKIVNRFVTDYYLLPFLEKKLIDSNVAARKGKGSLYGLKLLEDYLNALLLQANGESVYCLKLDISKYFYTISHEKLFSMLENDIKDKDVLCLLHHIIKETNEPYINQAVNKYNHQYGVSIPFYQNGVGLSIGAMTSQVLAVYYLNGVDHFIKEKLKCKYYVRYMDDFLLLSLDKEFLKFAWKELEIQLSSLQLKINPKTNIYNLKNGVDFLGYKYRVVNNKLVKLYNKKTFKRIHTKLKNLKKYDIEKYYKSYASYYGYLSKVKKVERDFAMKTKDKYLLYKEKYPHYLVIVKEGIFYKSYMEDAVILWHLFQYKMVGDCVSFGKAPYAKILSKFNQIGINYVILEEEELVVSLNEEVYDLTLKLSTIHYDSYQKKIYIHELIDSILERHMNKYEALEKLLNDFLTKQD